MGLKQNMSCNTNSIRDLSSYLSLGHSWAGSLIAYNQTVSKYSVSSRNLLFELMSGFHECFNMVLFRLKERCS